MKTKLILKSLAEIPANALALAASVPCRAVNASKQAIGPAVRATRGEIHAARHSSDVFVRDFFARANTPFQSVQPWSRGGLNE